MKTEEGNRSSCSNRGLRCSLPLNDNGYDFNASLVKNIKTEDMSFEQQLAKESGYQVGEVVSRCCQCVWFLKRRFGTKLHGSGLLTGSTVCQSGGGLSPSTTLEQMDFSGQLMPSKTTHPVLCHAGATASLSPALTWPTRVTPPASSCKVLHSPKPRTTPVRPRTLTTPMPTWACLLSRRTRQEQMGISTTIIIPTPASTLPLTAMAALQMNGMDRLGRSSFCSIRTAFQHRVRSTRKWVVWNSQ